MSLTCRIAGCRRKPHARGLCQRHYDQERKPQQPSRATGDTARRAKPAKAVKAVKAVKAAEPRPVAPPADPAEKNCVVPGCANPHHARGYCKSHYGQLRRRGRVEEPPPRADGAVAVVSKERRLLEIMKRHELLKKEIASIHKELESEVDGE